MFNQNFLLFLIIFFTATKATKAKTIASKITVPKYMIYSKIH